MEQTKKLLGKAKRQLKKAKTSVMQTREDLRKIKELLSQIDLTKEEQVTCDEVFAMVEPFRKLTGTDHFQKTQNEYNRTTELYELTGEAIAELKASLEKLIEEIRAGQVDDEKLQLHYELNRDIRVLFGKELDLLNRKAAAGVVFLDAIKTDFPDATTLN